jgi:hypothetical protein
LVSARGLSRFAEGLKFEFQNISAKPCSLARFFVLIEKNFTFFNFLKVISNFLAARGIGLCFAFIQAGIGKCCLV